MTLFKEKPEEAKKNIIPRPIVSIKEMLDAIDNEIGFIFDHEISFMQQFGKFKYEDLIEVTFCSSHIHVTYIIYTDSGGQHVCDTIDIDKYLEWKDAINS